VAARTGGGLTRSISKLLALFLLSLAPVKVHAQVEKASPLPDWALSPRDVPRRALVIGISSYQHATQLVTTGSDVSGVEKALRDLHFDSVDVLYGTGQTSRADLIAKIQAFASSLNGDELAFVYYSGHGTELKGTNYLVPSEGEATPEFPGSSWLSVEWMLSEFAKRRPGAIVLVLDACRANPFVNTNVEWRDVLDPAAPEPIFGDPTYAGGLVDLTFKGESALVVGYAAGFRRYSYSRLSSEPPTVRSVYTRHLLRHVTSATPLSLALARTEKQVPVLTSNAQVPTSLSHAAFDVQLDGTKAEAASVKEYWHYVARTVPLSTQVEELTQFIAAHPVSRYAPLARARLEAIRQGKVTELTVAVGDSQTAPAVAPAPAAKIEFLVGTLQEGAVSDGAATAITNAALPVRSSRFFGRRVSTILAGTKVRVLDVKSGSAKVLAPDGSAGWISGVDLADPGRVRREVTLTFSGSDEHAPVADWTPLSSASAAFGKTGGAVTIRIGQPTAEGAEHQAYVARLRSLRIRDYLLQLGAEPTRIVTVLQDAGTASNAASVSVGGVAR